MNEPIRPGTYKHYKGGYYKVIGEAKHTETEEMMVMYESMQYPYGQWWVRPKSMFLEYVTLPDSSATVVKPRFTWVQT
jgi:hypothetical protein